MLVCFSWQDTCFQNRFQSHDWFRQQLSLFIMRGVFSKNKMCTGDGSIFVYIFV